jgi:hypothetical protein
MIEEFSPNLAGKIQYIDKDLFLAKCAGREDNAGGKTARMLGTGGCATAENGIVTNPLLDLVAGDEDLIHEATHVYHNEVNSDDEKKMSAADAELKQYAREKGYLAGAKRREREMRFSFNTFPIEDRLRDNIEKHMELKRRGLPHDERLVGLYEKYQRTKEATFEYEWFHANEHLLRDGDFEELDEAGKLYEKETAELQAILIDEFGAEASDAFWENNFYYGGDRKELTLKGHIQDKIWSPDLSPEAQQRLGKAVKEWEDSKSRYRISCSERFTSKAVTLELDNGKVPIFNQGTRNYGLPSLYAFRDNDEAIAETVRSVYADKKSGLPKNMTRAFLNREDREMRENYIAVLRKHGFIK